jgi:hypothetical protein
MLYDESTIDMPAAEVAAMAQETLDRIQQHRDLIRHGYIRRERRAWERSLWTRFRRWIGRPLQAPSEKELADRMTWQDEMDCDIVYGRQWVVASDLLLAARHAPIVRLTRSDLRMIGG